MPVSANLRFTKSRMRSVHRFLPELGASLAFSFHLLHEVGLFTIVVS